MHKNFYQWLESRSHKDKLKIVYHWDTEPNFRKVLLKQGIPGDPNSVKALWVSPNTHWNEGWASWIVSGADHPGGYQTFYLHKIGMPRDLYRRYVEREKPTNKFGNSRVSELVISQRDWDKLTPISVKQFSRSELLKKHFGHVRRAEKHAKLPTGIGSSTFHPGSTGRPYGLEEKEKWRKDMGWKGYDDEL